MGTQPLPQKGGRAPSPVFGEGALRYLLYIFSEPRAAHLRPTFQIWIWMNQDPSSRGWILIHPRPRWRCVRWGRSSALKRAQPLSFRFMTIVAKRLDGWRGTWYGSRPRPRPHCVRRGPSSPRERGTAAPPSAAHVYCGHGRPSQLLLSSCTNGRPKLAC